MKLKGRFKSRISVNEKFILSKERGVIEFTSFLLHGIIFLVVSMKKELLSPVGSVEALYQAIHNGADAVYLGGKKFGARMYADNFTKEELKQAIDYCHLYGVKIYVTVNTIIFDKEIKEFLEYIKYLYISGTDAVIMQDVGMISLVRKCFPDLEIHASTQMHNHNKEGVKLLKELGVKRVVLARELSLKEINDIDVDIEKEVFIHGALCVCYSGCCLFSSMNSSRSGNRGECVASCRLPYQLFKNKELVKTDGNYLLSMQELNTSSKIKELLDSDVISFKIEGRMKSPEYVGFITRFYRTLIDKYNRGEEPTLKEEEINQLKTLFNRKFTEGYLFSKKGHEVMNIKNQNHIGLEIGKAIEITPKIIKIKLSRPLHQEDGIKFTDVDKGMIVNKLYNSKMLLTNKVEKGEIAIVDNKIGLRELSKVSITVDKNLLSSLQNYQEKKIGISYKVRAFSSQKLEITMMDGVNSVTMMGSVVESSIKQPITKENIIKQLSKLGNTPFEVNHIDIEMEEDIFLSLKELNEIRRALVEELIKRRTNIPTKKICEVPIVSNPNSKKEIKLGVLVRNEEQLKTCLRHKVSYIYTQDFRLYNQYKDKAQIFLRMERVMKSFPDFKNENIVASELGAIQRYRKENNVCSDYFLNVNNKESIFFLEQLGIKRICISPEMNEFDLINSSADIEAIAYGRLELMVMKYCPVNMILNQDNKKCDLCLKRDNFYLKNDNKCYPLIYKNHITHVMHYKNIDLYSKVDTYKKKGVNCFRLELFDEDEKATEELLKKWEGVFYE